MGPPPFLAIRAVLRGMQTGAFIVFLPGFGPELFRQPQRDDADGGQDFDQFLVRRGLGDLGNWFKHEIHSFYGEMYPR